VPASLQERLQARVQGLGGELVVRHGTSLSKSIVIWVDTGVQP
jgi:hypothetical protein